MKRVSARRKLFFAFISVLISGILFLSTTTLDDGKKKSFSLTPEMDGVYVIENIDIDYRYDKTKYEVVPFVNEPYAVIKGDKKLINLLKWSGKPKFFIDLNGKLPGKYNEKILFTGINKSLDVKIYPATIELRLMEQQTIKMKPLIELTGVDKIDKNYIVSVPKLTQEEVTIRDIQDKLNQVGQVKGTVDVSNMKDSQLVTVNLKVYDRDGKLLNINLIDKSVDVTIPIEKKVTVIKEEEVIMNIVVKEKSKTKPKRNNKDKKEEKIISKEGTLAFINIPNNLKLINKTPNLKWSTDVKIDLKTFKVGVYEMTLNDNGEKKVLKFELKPFIEDNNEKNDTDSSKDLNNSKGINLNEKDKGD